jgi:hypothetical protein
VLDWDHNANYHRLLLGQCRSGAGGCWMSAAVPERLQPSLPSEVSRSMLSIAVHRDDRGSEAAHARQRNCVVADVLAGPLPGKEYDAIFSISALHQCH